MTAPFKTETPAVSALNHFAEGSCSVAQGDAAEGMAQLERAYRSITQAGGFEKVEAEAAALGKSFMKSDFVRAVSFAANILVNQVRESLHAGYNDELDLAIIDRALEMTGGFTKHMKFTEGELVALKRLSNIEDVEDHFQMAKECIKRGGHSVWLDTLASNVERIGGLAAIRQTPESWQEAFGVPYVKPASDLG